MERSLKNVSFNAPGGAGDLTAARGPVADALVSVSPCPLTAPASAPVPSQPRCQPLSPHRWAAPGQTRVGCAAVTERRPGRTPQSHRPWSGTRSLPGAKAQPPAGLCPPPPGAVSQGPALRGRSAWPGPSGRRRADRSEAAARRRHPCEGVRPTPAKLFHGVGMCRGPSGTPRPPHAGGARPGARVCGPPRASFSASLWKFRGLFPRVNPGSPVGLGVCGVSGAPMGGQAVLVPVTCVRPRDGAASARVGPRPGLCSGLGEAVRAAGSPRPVGPRARSSQQPRAGGGAAGFSAGASSWSLS